MASSVRRLGLGSFVKDGWWPYDDDDYFAIAFYTKILVLDVDYSIMIETREKQLVFPLRHSWLEGDRVVGYQYLRAYLYESCIPEYVLTEIVSFYDEQRSSMPRSNRFSATIPAIVVRGVMRIPMGLLPTGIAVEGLLRFVSALYSRPTSNSSQKNLVPAAKRSIEGLEKRVVVDDKECPICLEKFGEGVQVSVMNCSHAFHGDCILQWLKTTNTCPLCRSQLPTT